MSGARRSPSEHAGRVDPGIVVIDEVVGMLDYDDVHSGHDRSRSLPGSSSFERSISSSRGPPGDSNDFRVAAGIMADDVDGGVVRKPRDARAGGGRAGMVQVKPLRRAAILAVGSELLTPSRIDTNSLFITEQLNLLGIDVVSKCIVGDDQDELAARRQRRTRRVSTSSSAAAAWVRPMTT